MGNIQTIGNAISNLVERKNTDYDAAFERTFNKYGWYAYFIRITDKLNRLENLTLNKQNPTITNESISDTVVDIIGYSLLLLELINRNQIDELVKNIDK